MKKRLIVFAAGAAVLAAGAVAVIPGGSAHGVTSSQCQQLFDAAETQSARLLSVPLTPTQYNQLNKAFGSRFLGQLSSTGCI